MSPYVKEAASKLIDGCAGVIFAGRRCSVIAMQKHLELDTGTGQQFAAMCVKESRRVYNVCVETNREPKPYTKALLTASGDLGW